MTIKYTEEEFDSAKSKDKLALECKRCGKGYTVPKAYIVRILKGGNSIGATGDYCSNACKAGNGYTDVVCACCGTQFKKKPSAILKTKNNFCTKACAATYNNRNKSTGNRRSKLEAWLEDQLRVKYPHLEIHFNRKDAINSEIDIYIPSMKLAFELNGIFHYEPIYGEQKLSQIQNNDHRKFQACAEHGISLCIIDSSSQKYFTEKTSMKYLEIIETIIKNHC